MPSLPIYNSNRNIQPQTSGPLQTGAEQPFIDQQKVIKTVADIGQKWSDAQDVMQSTDAKAKYKIGLSEIEAEAEADPNFEDSPKYKAKIDKLKQNTLKGISNVGIKNQLGLEFDYEGASSEIKIKANFGHKALENNKYQLTTYITEQQGNKATATPTQIASINRNIMMNLDTQVKTGLITQVEADKILQVSEKSAAEDAVYSNPELGRDALNRGAFRLDPKDKQQLIDQSYSIQKKEQEMADFRLKQTQLSSLIGLSDDLRNNTLTPDKVRNLQNSGMIDADTASIFYAAAINKTYEIPVATSLRQPDYFLRLIDDSRGDKVQVDKIMKDAAKAYADHKIGTNQYTYLIQEAKETFERQSKGIFTKNPIMGSIQGAIHSVMSIFKNESDATKGETINRIIEDVNSKNPTSDQAVNDITLEALAQKSPYYKCFVGKNIGENVTLPNGVVVKYNGFSDGDVDIEAIK